VWITQFYLQITPCLPFLRARSPDVATTATAAADIQLQLTIAWPYHQQYWQLRQRRRLALVVLRVPEIWTTKAQYDDQCYYYRRCCDYKTITQHIVIVIIRLKTRLQPSIGFTFERALTLFTRSGITPPKVSRFGWNLEHSQHILWGWLLQILGAIRAVAIAEEPH